MREECRFVDPKTIFGPLGTEEIPIMEDPYLWTEVVILVKDMKRFKEACVVKDNPQEGSER